MTTLYRSLISEGPSKFDLMLALFDGDVHNRRKIIFTITDEGKIRSYPGKTTINCVTRESGDGENWLFEGLGETALCETIEVHGYYSTKLRTGWIEPKV